MIKYIKNEYNLSVVIDTKEHVFNKHTLSIVRHICLNYLTSYEGYIRAVKYIFSFHRNIPLVLAKDLVLFPIKSVTDYENIWINHAAIEKTIWHDKVMTIYFYDDSMIEVTYSKYQYTVLEHRIREIKSYKAKNRL